MKSCFSLFLTAISATLAIVSSSQAQDRPNVIMMMADDLGWGDVGYHGNPEVMTPHLDRMAAEGVQLTRFYTASSICSPTRASVITGRHPYRTGIWAAHTNGMRKGEVTIAEIMKDAGYRTGFFGKWHLGHLEPERGGGQSRGFYSPPWLHGYTETFATQSAVPTYNPTTTPKGWEKWGNVSGEPWKGDGFPYLTGPGQKVKDNLSGDDSRIIMDRAVPFIEKSVDSNEPFFATIWFHTPHEPVVAGPEYLKKYSHLDDEEQRHFYGAITAMDDQIGRLFERLEELGVAENTIVFFTSDNGPRGPSVDQGIASAGPYRGHKHEHYEGGILVPSLAWWPEKFVPGKTDALSSTVDYLPTIADLAGLDWKEEVGDRPVDGVSLRPVLLDGKGVGERYIVSGYKRLFKGEDGIALVDQQFKLHRDKRSGEYSLFDLQADPYETKDLAEEMPDRTERMKQSLAEFELSAKRSAQGADYNF